MTANGIMSRFNPLSGKPPLKLARNASYAEVADLVSIPYRGNPL